MNRPYYNNGCWEGLTEEQMYGPIAQPEDTGDIKQIRIVWSELGECWFAEIENETGALGHGQTIQDAIDSLIEDYKEKFNKLILCYTWH